MAKVRGPLLSLEAHGTYGPGMQFRTDSTKSTVHRQNPSDKPRSTGQIIQAQKVNQMAIAWTQLSEPTKQTWRNCAATLNTNGRALFWQEWFLQGSSPGNNPTPPCP